MKILLFSSFFILLSNFSYSQNLSNTDLFMTGYISNFSKNLQGLDIAIADTSFLSGFGIYLDVRVGGQGPSDKYFYDDISINKAENIYGDKKIKEVQGRFSLNFGVVKLLTSQIAIYSGIGWVDLKNYNVYYDPTEILGVKGQYWINNSEKPEKSTFNFTGGFLLNWSILVFGIGFDTYPSDFNFSIGVNFGRFYDLLKK